MKVFALRDGLFSVDHTKVFIPFEIGKDNLRERAPGSVLLGIQPFLVSTGDDLVLLDTGLGRSEDGELKLYKNIRALGFEPDKITKVILSHLHNDHIGGIGTTEPNGRFRFYFPNAQYYLQEKELEYALQSSKPSFNKPLLQPLMHNDQVVYLNGNGQINDIIHYEVTGGHSPYHQAIWLKENGETIFFGADVAPMLFQMQNHIMAKYDYDGRKAQAWRRLWWQLGQKENWTFLFYHDVKNPVYIAGREAQ